MAQNRRRQPKRLFKRLVGVALIGLVGLFLLIQILLATPFARTRFAGTIEGRTGLEASVESLAWLPWTGFIIEGLVVEQPLELRQELDAPLLEVSRIRIWPDYGQLVRGKKAVRGVVLDSPHAQLSVEMLVALVGSTPQPEPPATVAEVDPKPGLQGGIPAVAVNSVPPAESEEGNSSSEDRVEAAEAPEGEAVDPAWIEVTDGRLQVLQASQGTEWLLIKGIEGCIPIGGGGEGKLKASLQLAIEQMHETNVGIVIKSSPKSAEFHITGKSSENLQLTGNLSVKYDQGAPFHGSFQGAGKQLALTLPIAHKNVRLKRFRFGGAAAGWLVAPSSWGGLLRGVGEEFVVDWGESPVVFDEASAQMILRAGTLQSPDFRLVGDTGVVLGNGWINRSGGAAVLRVITPDPDQVTLLSALEAAGATVAFRPIHPGNRFFADLSVWSGSGGWKMELGDGGAVFPLDGLIIQP